MSLTGRLKEMIETNGPLPVSVYMQLCLHDPSEGYYATRPGLGTDFITAPEISQVFGELIGLWAMHEWEAMGSPEAFGLVELGPGRGTLMADALRVTDGKPFQKAMSLNLVEASPALRSVQAKRLGKYAPDYKGSVTDIAAGHTLILANEYLDCLPVRQFLKSEGLWRERVVGVNDDDALAFGVTADRAPDHPASAGDAAELQPGLELVVDQLKRRHEAGDVFRALFVDYGTVDGAPGDSLRAFKQGEQIHPLAEPGACDLTVDVDFQRLRTLAQAAGLSVNSAIPQGGFLMRLGIEQRMQSLIGAQPARAEEIFEGVRRLVDPSEMGERFKVICISSPGLPMPAGF